jgi:hypothetical protein
LEEGFKDGFLEEEGLEDGLEDVLEDGLEEIFEDGSKKTAPMVDCRLE